MRNKISIVLLVIMLILVQAGGVFAEDLDYTVNLINNFETKKSIDELNLKIEEIHENLIVTTNGVTIILPEQIKQLDSYNNKIALAEERMNFKLEDELHRYIDLKYPLISEIEQYGVNSGYTQDLWTRNYFNEKDNDKYVDSLTDYDFFKQVSLEEFITAVENLDNLGINIEGVQIVFNPYRILSGYAYCEDYAPNSTSIRRTRIYFNPNDGEDIISTLYHELGHMIYNEQIEDNLVNYETYYNMYRKDFDKYNAKDNYGRWDYKLTENFAEDFKIYISNKIDNNDMKEFMTEHYNSFYGKDTVYPVHKDIHKYFDKLIKEQSDNLITRLRGDVGIKLKDYKEVFTLYDASYLNQHANKIVSTSDVLEISVDNENSLLELKEVSVYHKDKEAKIEFGEKINIRDSGVYEIYILFANDDYEEEITFFIIKDK